MRPFRQTFWNCVLVSGMVLSLAASCQTASGHNETRVPLRIVPTTSLVMLGLRYPEAPGVFFAPGQLKLESLTPAASGCQFRLPTGEQVSLHFGDWQVINIRRGDRMLPYEAVCVEDEKAGQKRHVLSWSALYRAEGMMEVGDCKRLIAVYDVNGDGVFDRKDQGMSTPFGVDINGDGQIFGEAEWFRIGDDFEVCGKRWEVARLSPSGDWIEIEPSELTKVRVGGAVPPFTLQLDNGETVDSQKMRGHWSLLDFWASWCGPCLAKVPEVNQLGKDFGDQFHIYMVNVDEPEQLNSAHKLIRKYELQYPMVWPGRGQADPVWRMFGTVPDDHFAIPLYVLVDPANRIAAVTRNVDDVRAVVRKSGGAILTLP